MNALAVLSCYWPQKHMYVQKAEGFDVTNNA